MPVSPTYPGVYIEEIPSGVRTIVGVSTSVTAFVDDFPRGPSNRAVQVFNEGDFQREFGGLHKDSEAGYAIRQFFLNGGGEAWVVRVSNGRAASVILQDTGGNDILQATAGRRVKDRSVDDPGSWGNNLRLEVDYDTDDPTSQFNLTVSEVALQAGRPVVVQTETHRNLTMTDGAADDAVEVVNEKSKLIQLERKSAVTSTERPARNGTLGLDASASGTNAVGNLSDGDPLDVHYDGSSRTVTLKITGTLSSLQQVRNSLQAALRKAGEASTTHPTVEPRLTGATVELLGDRLWVRAGRGGADYDPETLLTFTEVSGGSTAADLGLLGTGVFANVQQYSLGAQPVGPSIGAQKAVTNGRGTDGTLPDATALRGERSAKTGLYALEEVDLFNILCIPRAADLSDADAMRAVYSEAVTYCEERRAFLIVDLPKSDTTLEDARGWLDDNAGLRHKNAAAYFPRPRIPDPLNAYRLRSIGASGTLAGLYARTDAARGVWKAPAGIEGGLRGVPDLAARLTDMENGRLNPLGLNCLRNLDVYGNVSWGARTLDGADQKASEWKYIPVRRLALYLEESLYRGTQWVVFEPNDEPLWAQIRLNVGAFLHNLFRQGAFQGTTPRDAYLVKCDAETTTQNDIDRGIVNILVGFAPLKPAEFVILRIQQLAGQIQT